MDKTNKLYKTYENEEVTTGLPKFPKGKKGSDFSSNLDLNNSSTSLKKFQNHVKESKKLTPRQVILALLRERNWKQTQLADKIGISRQGLNNYLRGFWDYSDSIKIRIAEAFRVDTLIIWGLGGLRK